MMQHNVVKSLKNELLSREAEIKALKEELKRKDGLIQRETKKRRARTNAYIDCLGALTVLEKKLKSCEAQCDSLKANHLLELTQVKETWEKKVEVLQDENTALKEMSKKLTSEKNKLEDKDRQKDAFMQRVWKQKKADSDALVSSVCALRMKEKELKSCEAQCEALKAGHLLELTQVKETWGKEVEVLQKDNAALKETSKRLTSEKNKLEDRDRLKDAFMRRLWRQKKADRNAFLSNVRALNVKEKELKSCEAQCDALKASHLLELIQVKEIWGKKVEVLQQENTALKEKELKSCEAQCDAPKAGHPLELPQVEETWEKKVEDSTAEDVAVDDMVTLLKKEQPALTLMDSEPHAEMETVKEEDKPEVTESKPQEEKKRRKKWWKRLLKD